VRLFQQFLQNLTAFVLILVLTTTAACSGTVQAKQPTNLPVISRRLCPVSTGNSAAGQDFGNCCPNS